MNKVLQKKKEVEIDSLSRDIIVLKVWGMTEKLNLNRVRGKEEPEGHFRVRESAWLKVRGQ